MRKVRVYKAGLYCIIAELVPQDITKKLIELKAELLKKEVA